MARLIATATARDEIRRRNQRAVLNAIHHYGPISRSKLARELHLSPAAVTSITGDLIGNGLIYEAEQGTSKGAGRKPILLSVNYNHAYVLGVKVSNINITLALTNLQTEVLDWHTKTLASHEPEAIIEAIKAGMHLLLKKTRTQWESLVGLCVSLPGIVDSRSGRVRQSPLLGWPDTPIAALLEKHLKLPTLVENDVNALAAAEAWFGAGQNHEDFLVVTLGRGVGLGIVIRGRVYRGPQGGAGEFGHTVLTSAPKGEVRTVEDFLSDVALLEQAKKRLGDFPQKGTPQLLIALAEGGNPAALELFAEAGQILGQVLSNLVNIFAPTILILAGEGMRAAPFLLPTAKEALKRYCFGDLAANLQLVVDSWGDENWARGAAGLAASHYLSQAPVGR